MSRYIIFFIVFSFLGWVWESIYCAIEYKKWSKRGFLYGPICPIYGFGGILGLLFYDFVTSMPPLWVLFISGFIISILLEYPTSWLLEKIFHTRWWDYSHYPLNLNGRISLPTSIGFGVAAILIVKLLIPFINPYITALSPQTQNVIAVTLSCILLIDFIAKIISLTKHQTKKH